MRWFNQALTFGLALASISALGRLNRMVMVFDVILCLYHTFLTFSMPFLRAFPLERILKIGRERDGERPENSSFCLSYQSSLPFHSDL
jgi:hypothetical protein